MYGKLSKPAFSSSPCFAADDGAWLAVGKAWWKKSVRVVYHAGASATKLSFVLGLRVVNVFI